MGILIQLLELAELYLPLSASVPSTVLPSFISHSLPTIKFYISFLHLHLQLHPQKVSQKQQTNLQPTIKMQFTLLALPALLFSSALAAPVLDSTNLDSVTDVDNVSLKRLPVQTSAVDGAIAEVEDAVPETKRQAEPLVDLLDTLLAATAPIAGEIGTSASCTPIRQSDKDTCADMMSTEDALAKLGSSDPAKDVLDFVAEDVEGLLTELVIEVESVIGNLTSVATGGEATDLADILREVLKLVDVVVEDVEKALGGTGTFLMNL